jgi:acetylornithine aminotransferase
VVTLANGLGGGLPIGATLAFGDAARLLAPGQHGSTFGGNPVCAAAALALLDVVEREGLCGRALELGVLLRAGLEGLQAPLLSHVRGVGALLGLVLTAPVAGALEAGLRERGVLVNAVASDVIRVAPPLVLTDAQTERFVTIVGEVLEDLREISQTS